MTDNTTNAPVMVTLKPCPFCGGEASSYEGKHCSTVKCDNGHAIHVYGLSLAEAITAWNTRAPVHQSASPSGLVEALAPIFAVADAPADIPDGPFHPGEAARDGAMKLGMATLLALPAIRAAITAAPATDKEGEAIEAAAERAASTHPDIGDNGGWDVLPDTPRPGVPRSWCKDYWRSAVRAALTQSPPPNDAVREALEACRNFLIGEVGFEDDDPPLDKVLAALALLSAQPAPVEGVEQLIEAALPGCHFMISDGNYRAAAKHIAAALHPNTESGRTPVAPDKEKGR